MTREEEMRCLQVYKKHIEDYEDPYVYVNELRYPSTEKAVVVTLFCIDFESKLKSDLHKTCDAVFWVPRKLCWDNCSNGCNAKIPKWLAIKNLEKCIEENKTNLVN